MQIQQEKFYDFIFLHISNQPILKLLWDSDTNNYDKLIYKQSNKMKTFRIIGMALLAVIMCVNLASCSDDEEDPNVYNAYGIYLGDLSTNTDYIETELRINEVEQSIKFRPSYSSSGLDGGAYVTEFHPFTEEQYFYIINRCDIYVNEEITKENLIEKFPELPHEFNFLWQCLGEYEYIAYYPVDSPDGVLNVFVYNKNN